MATPLPRQPIEVVIERTCSTCGNEYTGTRKKLLRTFYAARNHKHNLESICKKCKLEKTNPRRKLSDDALRASDPIKHKAYHLNRASKTRAQKKNLEHQIDADWIEAKLRATQGICPICKMQMNLSMSGKRGYIHNAASLDRADSQVGYIDSNVWIICNGCNAIKNDYTLDELQYRLTKILEWINGR